MPTQRFVNPLQATRADIGAGLQNIMQAMYASKANGEASKRSAAQDVKDTADAYKAQAEGDQIRRVESGVQDFVPNFAKSLVPENEVPNVMARNKTGIWPAFEDPRRQQSVVEGQGPVDWSPEKDLALNDAKRNAAYLGATKEANFKDLAASMEGAASDRDLVATLGQFLPSGKASAAAPAGPAMPQLSLPSGPGMISAMPVQSTDENGAVTKPMSDGGSVSPIALQPSDVTMPPPVQSPVPPAAVASPTTDLTAPAVQVDAKPRINTEALLNAAAAVAGKHHEVSTALTGVATAARGQQEADFKERDRHNLKPLPGVEGAFYDDNGNVYDANKSRILSGDEARQLGLTQKRAGATKIDVGLNTFDKNDSAGLAKQTNEMRSNAVKATEFAGTVQALAASLEGYGGGPMAEFQAKIGHYLPESEYGRIASVEDVVNSLRTKLATTVRASGSGATSDFEMKSYLASIPGLINTPQGRTMMAEIADRIAEREVAAADIYGKMAREAAKNEQDFSTGDWRRAVRAKLGNLFTPEEVRQMRDGIGSPAPTGAAPQFSRQQLEAEKRRRGLP